VELSAAQRKIAFALIVFVLAGLGVYLLRSVGHGSASHGSASHGSAGQNAPAAGGPPAQSSAPAASASVSGSPGSSATPTATSLSPAPDIYQWLPFTKTGLSSAAAVAVKFGDAYGTFSYTENGAAYVATMQNLATPQLAQQISGAYSTPGVAHMRTSRKQVSAGTALITSLRAYGPTSLTFIVAITERITATQGGGQTTTSYAVTVAGGDTNWQVNDIELQSEGNS
jgi:hypothetical protein